MSRKLSVFRRSLCRCSNSATAGRLTLILSDLAEIRKPSLRWRIGGSGTGSAAVYPDTGHRPAAELAPVYAALETAAQRFEPVAAPQQNAAPVTSQEAQSYKTDGREPVPSVPVRNDQPLPKSTTPMPSSLDLLASPPVPLNRWMNLLMEQTARLIEGAAQ